MSDKDPESTFMAAVATMSDLGLGYLHVVEASPGDAPPSPEFTSLFARMRHRWHGVYVANGGFNGPAGEEAVKSGRADAIAYGRLFIANPDLPRRLQLGAALNEPDPTTFYGGDATGYTSIPRSPEGPPHSSFGQSSNPIVSRPLGDLGRKVGATRRQLNFSGRRSDLSRTAGASSQHSECLLVPGGAVWVPLHP